MTRFARAKGSKASNERIFEEATSWKEMKDQLLERKKEIEDEGERRKIEQLRNTNYQNFLKDSSEEANKSEWAEFPKAFSPVKNENHSTQHSHDILLKSSKPKKRESPGNEINCGIEEKKISRKKHNNDYENTVIEHSFPVGMSSKVEIAMPKIKKSKQKNKKINIVVEKQNNEDKQVENELNEKPRNKLSFNNLCNAKRKLLDMESLTENVKKKIKKIQEKGLKQDEKRLLKKKSYNETLKKMEESEETISSKKKENSAHNLEKQCQTFGEINLKSNVIIKKNKTGINTSKKEKLETVEFKRKKSFQSDKVMINGEEVALSYYHGFPIKKGDAINLTILRKQMISKGLPRSEIERTIKLERRKAEKALARQKKKCLLQLPEIWTQPCRLP